MFGKFRLYLIVFLGWTISLPVVAAQPGVKAQVVGGTVAGMSPKCGASGPDRHGLLAARCDNMNIEIPYPKVNTVEYGQTVSRRYARRF